MSELIVDESLSLKKLNKILLVGSVCGSDFWSNITMVRLGDFGKFLGTNYLTKVFCKTQP